MHHMRIFYAPRSLHLIRYSLSLPIYLFRCMVLVRLGAFHNLSLLITCLVYHLYVSSYHSGRTLEIPLIISVTPLTAAIVFPPGNEETVDMGGGELEVSCVKVNSAGLIKQVADNGTFGQLPDNSSIIQPDQRTSSSQTKRQK